MRRHHQQRQIQMPHVSFLLFAQPQKQQPNHPSTPPILPLSAPQPNSTQLLHPIPILSLPGPYLASRCPHLKRGGPKPPSPPKPSSNIGKAALFRHSNPHASGTKWRSVLWSCGRHWSGISKGRKASRGVWLRSIFAGRGCSGSWLMRHSWAKIR